MVEVLEHSVVIVNGREIGAAMIAAEVQNHPAADADEAWAAAARALVLRQLLLDEADRLVIVSEDLTDADGRTLVEEDARIEALLEQEVQCPAADEAVTRRFFDQHSDRFTSPTMVEAEHILFAAQQDDSIAVGIPMMPLLTVLPPGMRGQPSARCRPHPKVSRRWRTNIRRALRRSRAAILDKLVQARPLRNSRMCC